jgi:hypothetical protein
VNIYIRFFSLRVLYCIKKWLSYKVKPLLFAEKEAKWEQFDDRESELF